MNELKKRRLEKPFSFNCYLKNELLVKLNISNYEFDKIVKPHKQVIGEKGGYFYGPKQVEIIYNLVMEYRRNKQAA